MSETIKYILNGAVIHTEQVPDGASTEEGPPRWPGQEISVAGKTYRIMGRAMDQALVAQI